jgi:signal transduction histidine kinase
VSAKTVQTNGVARWLIAGSALIGLAATLVVWLWLPGDGWYVAVLAVGQVLATVGVAGLTREVARRRRVSEVLARRKKMLEVLQAVSVATNGAVTDRCALHLALRTVCWKLGWSAGIVHMAGEHHDLWVSTGICEAMDPVLIDLLASHRHQPMPPGPSVVALARDTRLPACSDDAQTASDAEADRPVVVAVPIIAAGEVVGVLEFIADTPRPFRFSSDLRDTLSTVGTQLGRVVERARHQQETADRVAELARVNRELQASKDAEAQRRVEAERRNTAKSEFLSTISHELRTPLNAVLGFAQLLEQDKLSPDQSEFVGYIARSGRHLLDLVNGLLDLSRIEAGHLDLSLGDMSVAAQVADATSTMSIQAERRRIDIVAAVPSDLCVHADPQRLFQVLLNLLSNAIKYNRDGGTVTFAATTVSESIVRITVDDTGEGIPPELLPRLFQPFDRLEINDVPGTGLGLALTRQLVEAMGGSIGVSSKINVGTRFWIELPRSTQQPSRRGFDTSRAAGTSL